MKLEKLKKQVKKLDPSLSENDETFKTALILLASVVVGPYSRKVVEYTGYDRSTVAKRAVNLRANKVWYNGKVRHSGWFDKNGGIGFWLDCGIADGLFERCA